MSNILFFLMLKANLIILLFNYSAVLRHFPFDYYQYYMNDISIYIMHIWFSSVQSLSHVCFQPHGLQHARPPSPSPTPRVYSNSCPLSWWCHPTISSSDVPFSYHLQSFPASGSLQMSQLFAIGANVLEFQHQHQSFQWTFRTDFH